MSTYNDAKKALAAQALLDDEGLTEPEQAAEDEQEEEGIPIADMRAGDLFNQMLDVMAEQGAQYVDARMIFAKKAVVFRIFVMEVEDFDEQTLH